MQRECGVATVDEVCLLNSSPIFITDLSSQEEVPEKWRADALSKVELSPEELVSWPAC